MDEYARHARYYDRLVGPFLKPIHQAIVAELTDARCGTVIDLCCGTGLLAGMAVSEGLTVTGVDLSPAMLEVARHKHPNVNFMGNDATALPFADDHFDAASISFALHEKPADIALGILAEARRVVRPGGLIVMADYRVTARAPLRGWLIDLVERLAGREHHQCYRRFMEHGGSDGFLEESDMKAILTATFMGGRVGLYSILI